MRRVADRLGQAAYVLAYRALRLWWFLRRPRHRGALVALWHGGEILMIRTSYRRRWDLPGGGVGRGEDARDAALRELAEEVGISLPPAALRIAAEGESFWEHRHDHVTIFEARVAHRPPLRIDAREIIEAGFRDPSTVDLAAVNPQVARYLGALRRRAS